MWGGIFFCFQNTGFRVSKISSKIGYNENWEIPPPSREHTDFLLHDVFPQTYYYLGSGNQCYAFISEDRMFVLKFFKTQNLFKNLGIGKNFLSFFSKFVRKSDPSQQLVFERIFTSYKEAYQELSEETGLLYVHFNKTQDLKTKVCLIDNRGKKCLVNLDSTGFVVQRRAQKIFERVSELARQQQWEEARQSFRVFFELIAARCKKGFADQNLRIRNNFGFLSGKAIQIDCGTLTRDSSMKYPSNFREEIMHVAQRLDQWAQEISPDLCLLIQEEAQRIINHSS